MRSSVDHTSSTGSAPQAIYEIQVEGELDQSWEQWFSGLTIHSETAGEQPPAVGDSPQRPAGATEARRTTLRGAVADQAALRGMLCRLWDLNLTVVAVRRTGGEESRGEFDES